MGKAGTTSPAPGRRRGSPPHAWGRLAVCVTRSHAHLHGSPPHAWGRRDGGQSFRRARRLTPTRVGTTLLRMSRRAAQRPVGLTPTRVGTTEASVSHPRRLAHPHTRGDDVLPTRGWPWRRRLTPTRVGTTCSWRCSRRTPRQAHPHTRGDDEPRRTPRITRESSPGSPPHAWGRRVDGSPVDPDRLTPTRVGTTIGRYRDGAGGRGLTPTRVGTTIVAPRLWPWI